MSAAAQNIAAPALRVGFLGLGWIGRNRLEALSAMPTIRVAALADSNRDAVQSAAVVNASAERLQTLEELLACELDAVVIATPSGQHAQQALRALEQGLAVFCQKPLATNADDAQRVIDAARRADRLLGVDLSYRSVFGMQALRDAIRGGALGTIQAIDLVFHNAWGPDKSWCMDRALAGGGCVLDLGVHLIDLALWLQDFPEVSVVSRALFCRGERLLPGSQAIEDLAYAELRQTNDAQVRIACSWNLHAGQDAIIGMRIHGTHGGAEWRNVNGSFYDFELDLLQRNQRTRLGGYPDEWGARSVQTWASSLADNPRFNPDAHSYAAAARVIDAIYG